MKTDSENPKSQVSNPKSPEAESATDEVRTPRVRAGACPKSPDHKAMRVYRTLGEIRYCVCDDCGHTWKKTGPAAAARAAKEKERQPAA